MIDKGADVNAIGGLHGSPLLAAASKNDVKSIKLLLRNGATKPTADGKYGGVATRQVDLRYRQIVDLEQDIHRRMWWNYLNSIMPRRPERIEWSSATIIYLIKAIVLLVIVLSLLVVTFAALIKKSELREERAVDGSSAKSSQRRGFKGYENVKGGKVRGSEKKRTFSREKPATAKKGGQKTKTKRMSTTAPTAKTKSKGKTLDGGKQKTRKKDREL